MKAKEKTVALGLVFLFFLIFAYFENKIFIESMRSFFVSPVLTVVMFFIHNVIVVSLIMIGMSFYVMVVKTFLPKRKIEYIVLNHPRLFALIFTIIILITSVMRVCIIMGGRVVDFITTAMAVFLPHGILEAIGIYIAVYRTLTERLSGRVLVAIYFIFLLGAILEAGFTIALVLFAR